MAIIDDIKTRYSRGSMLMRFIYINIGVFVLLHVLVLGAMLINADAGRVLELVEVPTHPTALLHRPWTVVTYMFSHYELLHILFNMLWLYWLGSLFLEYFMPRQLGGLYVLGGLGGALLFVLAYNLLPYFEGRQGVMLGASASVIAIVVAVATYAPNHQIRLLFIGDVALKWIAIITVGIDLLSIDTGNAGGHIAHLGGAAVGALWALNIRRGHDFTAPVNAIIDRLVGLVRRNHEPVGQPVAGKRFRQQPSQNQRQSPRQQPGQQAENEAELDRILEKIKQSGYTALTDDEKDFLFNASRRR